MELKDNQAALIIESDENGEITVNVSSPDQHGLAGAICHAIAIKLTEDQKLQTEILQLLEEEAEEEKEEKE